MKLPHRRQFLNLMAGAAALPTASFVARGQTTGTVRGAASPIFPGTTWETVEPEGWSPRRLGVARDYFDELRSTALLIVQNGRVVADWGDTKQKVTIYSVRKSFMSALYGIAVAKGQIKLDATLEELGVDDKPPSLTVAEKKATVRNLLMARSGIYHEAAAETSSQKRTRPKRGSHAPGTFWFYNNWDFNALGTILRKATGEDTFEAIEQYFARPVGMEHFSARDGEYRKVPASEHPAYHMKFTARDLARFGWLFLNQGRWADRQIVPAEWVAESTKPWSPNARPGVAYGYLWWPSLAEDNTHFGAESGPGAFSARGAGGQFIVVVPSRRMVVVHLRDRSEEDERLATSRFSRLMRRISAAAPAKN